MTLRAIEGLGMADPDIITHDEHEVNSPTIADMLEEIVKMAPGPRLVALCVTVGGMKYDEIVEAVWSKTRHASMERVSWLAKKSRLYLAGLAGRYQQQLPN